MLSLKVASLRADGRDMDTKPCPQVKIVYAYTLELELYEVALCRVLLTGVPTPPDSLLRAVRLGLRADCSSPAKGKPQGISPGVSLRAEGDPCEP